VSIKRFPAYLRDIQEEIEGYAKNYGLDFFPILYEVLDYKTMNEVAAYGGFPTRYPHWRFGMDYEQLSKSYEWGLSKIYEMVINTNPAYAYLLEGNSTTDQKIVMAHVCAHVDFFKNNYFFSKTNRKMIDGMANHASRVRRHMARQGQDVVEDFIDTCLSLENLIDPMSPYIVRQRDKVELTDEEEDAKDKSGRLRAKGYMESFINPPEYLEAQKKKREEKEKRQKRRFPEQPQRDILQFHGYRTVEAETGEDGVTLAQASPPALILMDIQLPGMSGIDALRVLRADERTRGIPVIAVTASAMTQDRQKIMSAGFDGYQAKPIDVNQFVAAVRAMLARPPAGGPA
jgi:spore cortex formation protein SpoVR/YcgB (stage V sporulation)